MSRIIVGGLDFETTGLEQEKGHRIIEAALVLRDLDTGAPVGKFVQRFNPQRPIDPAAQAVHGISLDDLLGKPTFEEVAPKLAALLQRVPYIVAHNGESFDLPFLFRELLRVGQPLPEVRLCDTMLTGRWATPDGSVPNLGTLCWASGVDYNRDEAHAAEYDVDRMLECFFKHYPRGFFKFSNEPFRLKNA
jgi:DNA polymerase III subunit epsilon